MRGKLWARPAIPPSLGTPPAIHYPPVWPLLLAAAWKIAPAFPANIGWFKLINPIVLAAAAAGLLDGRRVTTHHLDLAVLAATAPRATVIADRVFVQDGDVWSSAGVTAGIDLALHLVSEQLGPVVAARVAQRMALALRRGPDDPQLSPFLAHRQHLNARLHRVQDAIARAPREAWDLTRMAAVAATTPRTLNRLFTEHAGTTPLAYLRGIRLALARTALEAGSSVGAAADAAGFHSDLQLRRAWHAAGLSGSPNESRGTG